MGAGFLLDEMTSKYGFNDGSNVPMNADEIRARLIKALNKQLPAAYRAEAYDRPGVHNWCLILFKTADGNGVGPGVEEIAKAIGRVSEMFDVATRIGLRRKRR